MIPPDSSSTASEEAPLLEVHNIEKHFASHGRHSTLKWSLLNRIRRQSIPDRKSSQRIIWQGLNFRLNRGQTLLLKGGNGSGKTSLMRILAGVYPPSSGKIYRRGHLVALLNLGGSFHLDLDLRDNLNLWGAMWGYHQNQVNTQHQEIMDFAGLGDVQDRPLRYFSSGMLARLALSLGLILPSDLLLIDELLSVCDDDFRQKAHVKILQRQAAGSSHIISQHSELPFPPDHVFELGG